MNDIKYDKNIVQVINKKAHFARYFNAKYEQQPIVKSSAASTNFLKNSSGGIRTS